MTGALSEIGRRFDHRDPLRCPAVDEIAGGDVNARRYVELRGKLVKQLAIHWIGGNSDNRQQELRCGFTPPGRHACRQGDGS